MHKERELTPDILKALMIILMVFGHMPRTGELSEVLNSIVDFIYLYHMPIFLMISGYFFNPLNIKTIKIKIFYQLFIPYFIFISIYILLLFLANSYGLQTSNSLTSLTFKVYLEKVFINPIGAYWYLHTLIFYQTLLVITTIFFEKKSFLCVLLFFAISSITFITLFNLNISITNLSFLIIGYGLRQNKYFPSNVSTLIIIILLLTLFNIKEIQDNIILHVVFVISMFSFLSYISSKMRNYFQNYFVYIGRNTLIILLLHVFFINLIKLINEFILSIDSSGISFSIFGTLFVIHCSIFTSLLIDQLRLSKYIFFQDKIYIPLKRKFQ